MAVVSRRPRSSRWTIGATISTIIRHAQIAFRHKHGDDRDDLIQEVVAKAAVAFLRLVELGKADLAYPSVLARYGVDVGHIADVGVAITRLRQTLFAAAQFRQLPARDQPILGASVEVQAVGRESQTADPFVAIVVEIAGSDLTRRPDIPKTNRVVDPLMSGSIPIRCAGGCQTTIKGEGCTPDPTRMPHKTSDLLSCIQVPKSHHHIVAG